MEPFKLDPVQEPIDSQEQARGSMVKRKLDFQIYFPVRDNNILSRWKNETPKKDWDEDVPKKVHLKAIATPFPETEGARVVWKILVRFVH